MGDNRLRLGDPVCPVCGGVVRVVNFNVDIKGELLNVEYECMGCGARFTVDSLNTPRPKAEACIEIERQEVRPLGERGSMYGKW